MGKMSDYVGNEGVVMPVDDGQDFGLLTPGWYPAVITKIEIKPILNKVDKQTVIGARFIIEFTIVGDHYANRKVWNENGYNFVHNESLVAQNIGREALGRLCLACGFEKDYRLTDEDVLINKTVDVRVEVEPAKGEYKARSIAKKFAPIGSESSKPQTAAAPVAPAPVAPVVPPAPVAPVNQATYNALPVAPFVAPVAPSVLQAAPPIPAVQAAPVAPAAPVHPWQQK